MQRKKKKKEKNKEQEIKEKRKKEKIEKTWQGSNALICWGFPYDCTV